jgi:hypothetical protein
MKIGTGKCSGDGVILRRGGGKVSAILLFTIAD